MLTMLREVFAPPYVLSVWREIRNGRFSADAESLQTDCCSYDRSVSDIADLRPKCTDRSSIIGTTEGPATNAFHNLLGKSGSSGFNLDVLGRRTDVFLDRCLENPNEKAADVMRAVTSELPTEVAPWSTFVVLQCPVLARSDKH